MLSPPGRLPACGVPGVNRKVYFGLALLLVVVIFTLQNVRVVTIHFLFWEFAMSRALMIFFVLAIGVIIGWIAAGHHARRRRM